MSARDVLAASLWLIDREIAGAPLPHPSWETFRENDPETAMIYETQAGVHIAALAAAGLAVVQDVGETTPQTVPWRYGDLWRGVQEDADEACLDAICNGYADGWNQCRRTMIAAATQEASDDGQ